MFSQRQQRCDRSAFAYTKRNLQTWLLVQTHCHYFSVAQNVAKRVCFNTPFYQSTTAATNRPANSKLTPQTQHANSVLRLFLRPSLHSTQPRASLRRFGQWPTKPLWAAAGTLSCFNYPRFAYNLFVVSHPAGALCFSPLATPFLCRTPPPISPSSQTIAQPLVQWIPTECICHEESMFDIV